MNKDTKTPTHHLIFFRTALIFRLWQAHNKNLPNWIMPMSDEQSNDLLSRTKSQQKPVHLDLSKWQTTAKNNWSRLADERSPLLISFSVCQLLWFFALFFYLSLAPLSLWFYWNLATKCPVDRKANRAWRCSSNYRWSPICQKSHMARHPILPVGGVLDQESWIPLKI